MKQTRILRKRFIPDETVDISGDELLYSSEELLITRWNAIKPRKDLLGGYSFAFLKEGYKISRFYNHERQFVFWYCDIIDVAYDGQNDVYTFSDLLVDLKVWPDGRWTVLDMGELADALEQGIISQAQVCSALRKLEKLLVMLENGQFPPKECCDSTYEKL